MGSLSIWHWLVVLLIIMLVFGTKKLSNLGSDLGKAIRNFQDGLKEEKEQPSATNQDTPEVQVKEKEQS